MITQRENGDVLEDGKVIASWWISDFARIVAMANRAEQLEAHLVAVCGVIDSVICDFNEDGFAVVNAARAFLAGDK